MIDIIIPYYNNRGSLTRAIASLLAQTYKGEIVINIIDDCSSVSIDDILEFYKKFLNINYFKLPFNMGKPGMVRQRGIELTKEPYIMFLDQDDIFDNRAIELATRLINSAEFSTCVGTVSEQKENYDCYTRGTQDWILLHGNIYKREHILKNNIRFPQGYAEDDAFNIVSCLSDIDSLVGIDKNMYYWLSNPSSVSRSGQNDFFKKVPYDYPKNVFEAYSHIISSGVKDDLLILRLGQHIAFCYYWYTVGEAMATNKEEFNKQYFKLCKEKIININKFLTSLENLALFYKTLIPQYEVFKKENIITIEDYCDKIGLTAITKKDINKYIKGAI